MIAQVYGLTTRVYTADFPIPQPNADAPGALKDRVNTGLNLAFYVGLAALVLGLIIAVIGGISAHHQGRGFSEMGSKVGIIAVGCIVLGSVTAIVGFLVG